MKTSTCAWLILLAIVLCPRSAGAQTTLELWPGTVPGETEVIGEETLAPKRPGQRDVQRITNVSRPSITIFRPPADKDTGTSVLICPGGGYQILAWDLEGEEVATWLNSIGVTGIVLKYRVPPRQDPAPRRAPLQDAQRALSIIRSHAQDWRLDPDRIGILGFSAGGHLSASAMTHFDERQYDAVDAADRVSCRPDFAVLVYPAYLEEKGSLKPEIRVTSKTPPTFLAHAGNDPIGPENSIALYTALKRAGVPAELHVYATGGHGFGLRPSEDPCSQWPERCAAWLKSRGLLDRPEKPSR
ncbi:MAG: alpha/beta hydrolase [Isosphaeraceae bacterium]|nr:alpha/beta hydrolase [Isosphaeraceae bacterium]